MLNYLAKMFFKISKKLSNNASNFYEEFFKFEEHIRKLWKREDFNPNQAVVPHIGFEVYLGLKNIQAIIFKEILLEYIKREDFNPNQAVVPHIGFEDIVLKFTWN